MTCGHILYLWKGLGCRPYMTDDKPVESYGLVSGGWCPGCGKHPPFLAELSLQGHRDFKPVLDQEPGCLLQPYSLCVCVCSCGECVVFLYVCVHVVCMFLYVFDMCVFMWLCVVCFCMCMFMWCVCVCVCVCMCSCGEVGGMKARGGHW